MKLGREVAPFGRGELKQSLRTGFGAWNTGRSPAGMPCPDCGHTESFHYWNPVDNRNECVAVVMGYENALHQQRPGKRCGCGGSLAWSGDGSGLRW